MVFKNDPNHGTILIPVDEIPTSERKLLESVYHGEASVLKPFSARTTDHKIETVAAHISSSYVQNLMNTDNTLSQVSLELCNSKRAQQLQIMAAMNEKYVHFGKARPGVLARKAGEVVHLLQGVSMKAWLG